jgi:hypothetical protein
MTDKEIALELGDRLLYSKLLIEEINLELNLSREISPLGRPTQQILEDAKERALRPAYRDKIEELHRKLDASTPDAMLRTLQASLDELLK